MPDTVWFPRPGTSDQSIINGTLINDEYDLRDLPPLEGDALDIGAHIGSVAIPLALSHPRLTVIAVEALPENAALLRRHVEANRLDGRVIVVEAAIADHDGEVVIYGDYTHIVGQDDDYTLTNRWIGGIGRGPHLPTFDATAYTVRAITLTTLLDQYGIGEAVFTKTDCETGEWAMFADPAIGRLHYIVGEYHDRPEDDVFMALCATHEVTTRPDALETTGGIGKFWAVRRRLEAVA